MSNTDTSQTKSKNNRRNRLYLLFIIALFAAPPLASWLLIDHWRPSGTTQHGDLLTPARPLPEFQATAYPTGSTQALNLPRGRWVMAYLSETENCQENCQQSLVNMRQMQLALGKDKDRVQTALLLTQTPNHAFAQWLQQEHATMQKLRLNNPALAQFIKQAFADTATDGSIYLIDPLGNLFMHYGSEIAPRDIMKDIRRLLKYTKLG